jgi:predicted nucleic acid-binding protein
MDRALAPAESLHAPHLLDIEILHAVRRLVQREEISVARAEQALADFSNFLIQRHGHQQLTARIWQFRDSLTAYDVAYVALAEALDAPLLTCDAKLAHADGHQAQIELVS